MKEEPYIPGAATVFRQSTPFNEELYLQKARGFLAASPTSALSMALAVIGFKPS